VFEFDNITGTFTEKFELSHPGYNVRYPHGNEFSPNSKNLIVVRDSTFINSSKKNTVNSQVLKFDVTVPDNEAFKKSKIKIVELYTDQNSNGSFGHMQSTPDGRILIGRPLLNYLSALNSPNSNEILEFEEQAIRFDSYPGNFPAFPSFFFKEGGYVAPQDDLLDIKVCPGEPVTLNSVHIFPDYIYEWKNIKTNEIFEGMNPVLTIPTNLFEQDTSLYELKMTDPTGCSIFDVVGIITLKSPKYEIIGSKSVCPGITEVAYSVENAIEGISFDWSITGGEIVDGQGTEKILVNWGGPNLSAIVNIITTNKNGCKNTSNFPVKVFKELDTEKPKGVDTLSCDIYTYDYSTFATNGSHYNWHIINGEILKGQGSDKVQVAWNIESERGYLWIEESVDTNLEICFGRSDTLMVINPKAKGNQQIDIHYVTAVRNQPEIIQLNYSLKYHEFFEDFVTIYHKEAIDPTDDWKEVTTTSSKGNEVVFSEPLSPEIIYDYKIVGKSICGDIVSSTIHNNIVLKGSIIEESQQIGLDWNPYAGWTKDVNKYEIYRKLDAQEEFTFIQSSGNLNVIFLENLSDGFDQCFYIKALSNDHDDYYSLSNEICLSYDHPLFIPNVITPNGDGINDSFIIDKISLFPENEIAIINRLGKKVYQEKNYRNQWDAQDLPTGVYYYYLITQRNKKEYKGYIHVLR
nr:gliding motility-associated C-terminal domain-containing protein [Bacteroidota bacterium]